MHFPQEACITYKPTRVLLIVAIQLQIYQIWSMNRKLFQKRPEDQVTVASDKLYWSLFKEITIANF